MVIAPLFFHPLYKNERKLIIYTSTYDFGPEVACEVNVNTTKELASKVYVVLTMERSGV
jgi:hypothetical protein